MLSGISTFSSQVDNVFLYILIISLIFFVGIVFAMILFIVKFHHKKNKQAKDIHGNVTLEVLWTVIPTLLVISMFYFGFKGFRNMRTIPENTLDVNVQGRMWSWMYTYDNGFQTDTLVVPVGKPVKITLESADVLHSFYIPVFRIKQDAVPGSKNYLWFQATKAGEYDVLCAEYCGDRHSYMLSTVKAVPPEEFDQWYATTKPAVAVSGGEGEGEVSGPSPTRGEMLYKTKGCIACHSIDGSPRVGPSFYQLFGHQVTVITNGAEKTLTVDEDYIKRSILDPGVEKVKGFENIPMPPQNVTDEEIEDIIAYIRTLE